MDVKMEELRERIEIIQEDAYTDDSGNLITDKAQTVATVWAFVLPYSAKISDGYAEKVVEISYRIAIRYREDIKVSHFILWRNKKLEIAAPPYGLNGRRKFSILECRELVEDNEV